MTCPYFKPTQRCDGGGWPHPARLPLGAGWSGHCSAPGHDGAVPSDDETREFCNLGYAAKCFRLPADRPYDAVRFSVAREANSAIWLWFVCETAHRPAQHGQLEYDTAGKQWAVPHADFRIQRMADCFLQSYLSRKSPALTPLSPHHE